MFKPDLCFDGCSLFSLQFSRHENRNSVQSQNLTLIFVIGSHTKGYSQENLKQWSKLSRTKMLRNSRGCTGGGQGCEKLGYFRRAADKVVLPEVEGRVPDQFYEGDDDS
jgi:hypothetical protein